MLAGIGVRSAFGLVALIRRWGIRRAQSVSGPTRPALQRCSQQQHAEAAVAVRQVSSVAVATLAALAQECMLSRPRSTTKVWLCRNLGRRIAPWRSFSN